MKSVVCAVLVALFVCGAVVQSAFCEDKPAAGMKCGDCPILSRMTLTPEVKAKVEALCAKCEVKADGGLCPMGFGKKGDEFRKTVVAELDAKQKELYEKAVEILKATNKEMRPLRKELKDAADEKAKAAVQAKIQKAKDEMNKKLDELFGIKREAAKATEASFFGGGCCQ